jgi:WD40 repeat protein
VASDSDYGDASHWCDFDAKGQLVTSSLDGQIRLYDDQFHLAAKRAAPGGKEPFAVTFSPDGARIAVGFADAPVVNLLSGKDLQPLEHPSRKGIDNGDLSKVAWSSDGQHLFAGGRFQLDGKFPDRGLGKGRQGRTALLEGHG